MRKENLSHHTNRPTTYSKYPLPHTGAKNNDNEKVECRLIIGYQKFKACSFDDATNFYITRMQILKNKN